MLEAIFTPSVQQAVFRNLLKAQSFPGLPVALSATAQGAPAHRAVLAALLDGEVSLADPQNLLDEQADWPFFEARRACHEQADFILLDGARVSDIQPRLGTLAEPEKSATLLILLENIGKDGGLALRLGGPGIKGERELRLHGLDAAWLAQRKHWNAAFPLGVDFIFADEARIAALPRTTHVEVI